VTVAADGVAVAVWETPGARHVLVRRDGSWTAEPSGPGAREPETRVTQGADISVTDQSGNRYVVPQSVNAEDPDGPGVVEVALWRKGASEPEPPQRLARGSFGSIQAEAAGDVVYLAWTERNRTRLARGGIGGFGLVPVPAGFFPGAELLATSDGRVVLEGGTDEDRRVATYDGTRWAMSRVPSFRPGSTSCQMVRGTAGLACVNSVHQGAPAAFGSDCVWASLMPAGSTRFGSPQVIAVGRGAFIGMPILDDRLHFVAARGRTPTQLLTSASPPIGQPPTASGACQRLSDLRISLRYDRAMQWQVLKIRFRLARRGRYWLSLSGCSKCGDRGRPFDGRRGLNQNKTIARDRPGRRLRIRIEPEGARKAITRTVVVPGPR